MTGSPEQADRELDELLAAIQAGSEPPHPVALEPADVEMAARLVRMTEASRPDAAFIARLGERLEQRAAERRTRRASPLAQLWQTLRQAVSRVASLAGAAILIVALFGMWALISERSQIGSPNADAPASAPAGSVTHAATEPAAIATSTVTAPGATATVISSVLPTRIPTSLPTEVVVPIIGQAAQRRHFYRSVSPDGQWVADTVLGTLEQESIPVTFTIWRADGTQRWVVVDEARRAGLGFPSPAVVRWTANGLFYTESGGPDGCAMKAYQSGLYRVNLVDGSREVLVEESSGTVAVATAGNLIAYLSRPQGAQPAVITRNLVTGQERSLPLPLSADSNLAALDWSPDSQSLLVVSVENGCGGAGTTTIVRLNVQDGEVAVLLEGDARRLHPNRWSLPGRVILEELTSEESREWILDTTSGELTLFDPPDGVIEQVREEQWRSPDGQWIASAVQRGLTGDSELVELSVTNLYESKEWAVIDEVRAVGQGAPHPHVLNWSGDGQSLYFTEQGHADGCPAKPHDMGFYHLNLLDGAVATMVEETSGAVTLSPDGQRVAFLMRGEDTMALAVQDLRTGERRIFDPLPIEPRPAPDRNDQLAALLWSPNGTALLAVTTTYDCTPRPLSFYLIPLDEGSPRTLAESVETTFGTTVEWTMPDTVRLRVEEGVVWRLDVDTGELTR